MEYGPHNMSPLTVREWLAATKACACVPCVVLSASIDVSPANTEPIDRYLTPADIFMLKQLALGASNAEISLAMGRALSTTKTRLSRLYRELSVHGRLECALRAREMGLTA